MRKPIIVVGVALLVVVALGAAYYLGSQTVRETAEKESVDKEQPASSPPPAPREPSRPLAIGETAQFEHGTVRVYSYQDDVQANTGFESILQPGNKFAAIDVESCNRDSQRFAMTLDQATLLI